MLRSDIFDLILKKYEEIKKFYSKSLDITSKILLLLIEKEADELKDEFDQREKAIFAAELKVKEVVELSRQFAKDMFMKEFNIAEIGKLSPEYAEKIKIARAEIVEIIEKNQKQDEKLKQNIENSMNQIRSRLKQADSTKKLKKSYGPVIVKPTRIDKNI